MKNLSLTLSACLIALVNGCAMQTADEREVGLTAQSLTVQECNDIRDECVDDAPTFLGLPDLFAIAACNGDQVICIAEAGDGLPQEVVDAVAEAAECTAELDDCILAANRPSELTACAEAEAECVAAIVDVDLPAIVDGTSVCVDGAVSCIEAAQSVSELTACGEGLGQCAVEQVSDVVPDVVSDTVQGAVDCADDLTSCIEKASRPSELTACSEANLECIATTLDVDLPDVPAEEAVDCAEAAAECALDVSSIDDVTSCASDLVGCTEAVIDGIDVPVVNCQLQFNQCLFSNPFQFGMCAQQLSSCQ